jgi:Raf kinase inhibitor-like YbhB/YbcL family protein
MVIAMLVSASCGPAPSPSPSPVEASPTPAPTSTATTEPAATQLPTATATPVPPALTLASPAFGEGGMFPSKYTRRGDDISPPLEWDDPPEGTVSFALIFYSQPMPDGGGNWVQWILCNIPGDARSIAEGITPDDNGALPDGSLHYLNSWGELKYGGPNPHHVATENYYFELYALDTMLDLDAVKTVMEAEGSLPWIGASKAIFMRAIEGHVLALGELWGQYKEPDQ